ncbi:hypothetical protein [Streptomyces sp. NBC_00151]|uniref:hypothetical protein n=1 Tax=Streptomyces sp. NBC_00151 TaxID=2975669 RepID=UPI002DD86385|nr:hypothetical protein [Streptomyces sp. NBC_00151]WRZ44590.1 hypothetical protein OG915_45325 [Streptomyces sp. NBC_00151]
MHQADAAPDRSIVPRLAFGTWPAGRPESADPAPEPAWYPQEKHPPQYELTVWEPESEWMSLAWFTGGRTPAGIAADLLQVGADGRYRFAETWGPRHPDAWAHDWTQEGRTLTDHHLDMPYAEDAARHDARRQQQEADLVTALAERSGGVLTPDQAAERLRTGGQVYRDFLRAGQACIARALNRARRAAQGEERPRLRAALDALEERNEVTDWVIDLTHADLDAATDLRGEDEQVYVRRSLTEYLTPGSHDIDVPA